MSDVKATLRSPHFINRNWDWRESRHYVLIAAVSLSIAAAVLGVFLRGWGGEVVLGVLALFAAGGIFCLFAIGLGFLRFADATPQSIYAKRFADRTCVAAVITTAEGDVVYANPAYDKLFSENTRLSDRPQAQFAGHEEADAAMFRLTRAAARRLCHIETVNWSSRKNGERWLRISVEPLNGNSEMSQRLSLWQFVDVTEEHRREKEISDRVASLSAWLQQMPAGLLVADADGRVVQINDALRDWARLNRKGSAQDLKLSDIFPEEETRLLLQSASAPGSSASIYTVKLNPARADGNASAAWVISKALSLPESREKGICAAVIPKDVPPAQESADSPGEDIDRNGFFNAAPIAIATVDAKGRVRKKNAAFLRTFNLSPNRRRRKANLLDLVGENARERVAQLLKDAVAGKPPKAPVDITFEEEGKRTGQLYVVPLPKGTRREGEDVAVVYGIDTSQQRALEEQIAQSQKMQAVGQLAGGVAHDFNNVLTAIIGYSDLLLGSHRPSDPAFKDIMNIKQNANRAAALVRHLLAFSRRQTLRPKVLSLTDVIEDFSILLGRLLGEKVTARVIHGRDLWLVKADANQLEQVIMNLAVNARDAMLPEGGELTIRTANVTERESLELVPAGMEPGEYVLLEVSDTGCGMPPEVLEKIFEPFFSTKEVGKGTGLGLSTVYGIVKQTGGYIFPESHVGEGTIFRIYLPRYVEDEHGHAEAEPKQEKKESQRDLTGSETILLVEDEEAVRGFASRALATRGYKVIQAASGVEALEIMAAHEGEIDLVISDVVMPEMDGPTLLKQLRKRNPDLKIIFISGYAEEAFRNNLDAEENFAFLPKPFSLKKLAAAVKEVLG